MSREEMRIVIRGDRPRIAVIRLGALGDCVYTFPLVSALKARFPHSEITWVVEEQHQDVPRLHPGVNEVIAIETKGWRRDFRVGRLRELAEGVVALRRSFAARDFEIALDPQGLIKSGVIAWLTCAPVRVGFGSAACRERGNTFFTTHRINAPVDGHIVRKNLSLLAPFGIRVESPDFGIHLSQDAKAKIRSLHQQVVIGREGRLVGIHPGVGHPRKRWDAVRYAKVGDQLHEQKGVRVILTAGPGEEAMVRQVASQMRSAPVVMPPLRVGELAALLSQYDLLIAGDTGPLHLAAAMGCRTVAIYGPSDPVRVAPFGEEHWVLKKACPCGWTPELHFNRHCAAVPCLEAITTEEVVLAAKALLERPSAVIGGCRGLSPGTQTILR